MHVSRIHHPTCEALIGSTKRKGGVNHQENDGKASVEPWSLGGKNHPDDLPTVAGADSGRLPPM